MRTHWAARTGAICYALWGVLHVLGAGMQLSRLGREGGAGLAAMLASAGPPGVTMPAVAAPGKTLVKGAGPGRATRVR